MYYVQGTYLTGEKGNNAISYAARKKNGSDCKLRIPPMITGSIADVRLGREIVFEETEQGGGTNPPLFSYCGLEALVHIPREKPIYIIDNHNHAFWCWRKQGQGTNPPPRSLGVPLPFQGGKKKILIHIDQHSDMGNIENYVVSNSTILHTDFDIATFTNEVLQVGTFILPALALGWFSECLQIRTVATLQSFFAKYKNLLEDSAVSFRLDIDLDFRAPGMAAAQDPTSFSVIQKLLQHPQVSGVTIATSPYFLDQEAALLLLKNRLLSFL